MELDLARQGQLAEAIAELERARTLDDYPDIMAALGFAYALAGRRGEVLKVVSELKDRSSAHGFFSSFDVATVYWGLDEKEVALDWLERAYAERSNSLVFLKVNPAMDRLRVSDRFVTLLGKVGLPP